MPAMQEKAAARAYVSGRVQGVGFRYWTVREARALGLSGWVKNLPDGGVEALFEGDRESLKQMLLLLEEGPPAARVTSVQSEWREYSGRFSGFNPVL